MKIITSRFKNGKTHSVVYLNDAGFVHREDGPAIIEYDTNGDIISEKFFLNGKIQPND